LDDRRSVNLNNNDLGLGFGSFIHCRQLYSASSSGTTQRRSQPSVVE